MRWPTSPRYVGRPPRRCGPGRRVGLRRRRAGATDADFAAGLSAPTCASTAAGRWPTSSPSRPSTNGRSWCSACCGTSWPPATTRPGARTRRPKRAAAAAQARAALAAHVPAADRRRFERALRRAHSSRLSGPRGQRVLRRQRAGALVRRPLLEIGRRLARRGQLADRDDVFSPAPTELAWRCAARDGPCARPGRPAQPASEPGRSRTPARPATAGPAATPPSMRPLPAEARFANEAFLWLVDRSLPDSAGQRAAATASCCRDRRLRRQLHRARPDHPRRERVRPDPRRRRAGLPDHLAGLVGAVPEHRRAGHRHRRVCRTRRSSRGSTAFRPSWPPGARPGGCMTASWSPWTARLARCG